MQQRSLNICEDCVNGTMVEYAPVTNPPRVLLMVDCKKWSSLMHERGYVGPCVSCIDFQKRSKDD